MKYTIKYIAFIVILQFLTSCRHDNKIEMIDCRILSDKFADVFLKKYLDQPGLDNLEYFILQSYRDRYDYKRLERVDSLLFSIRPILQKSDSLSYCPMGYFKYNKKTVFILLESNYCSFPIDPHSKTINLFYKVVRSMPVYEKNYQQYPQWTIRFSNSQYGNIDTITRYPQMIPEEIGGKFVPPVIKPDE